MWLQRTVQLPARSRGFHLVTDEVREALPELGEISVGEHRDHGGPRSVVATAWGD